MNSVQITNTSHKTRIHVVHVESFTKYDCYTYTWYNIKFNINSHVSTVHVHVYGRMCGSASTVYGRNTCTLKNIKRYVGVHTPASVGIKIYSK